MCRRERGLRKEVLTLRKGIDRRKGASLKTAQNGDRESMKRERKMLIMRIRL